MTEIIKVRNEMAYMEAFRSICHVAKMGGEKSQKYLVNFVFNEPWDSIELKLNNRHHDHLDEWYIQGINKHLSQFSRN